MQGPVLLAEQELQPQWRRRNHVLHSFPVSKGAQSLGPLRGDGSPFCQTQKQRWQRGHCHRVTRQLLHQPQCAQGTSRCRYEVSVLDGLLVRLAHPASLGTGSRGQYPPLPAKWFPGLEIGFHCPTPSGKTLGLRATLPRPSEGSRLGTISPQGQSHPPWDLLRELSQSNVLLSH
jgi:hypothetical protein